MHQQQTSGSSRRVVSPLILRVAGLVLGVCLLFPLLASASVPASMPGPVGPLSSEVGAFPENVAGVKDNDVYLITPQLWAALQRFVKGELFDLDAELTNQIARDPHVFSLYYFAGLVKVRRLLLDPEDKRDDKQIEQILSTCIAKAQNAQRLPRYYAAGVFYETMCQSTFAMFHGVRGNWLTTHHFGRSAMRSLEKIREARPNLEAVLLFEGIYNYYTGRFGFMSRLLLRLAGMPVGDTDLGVRQIRQAADQKGPFHYFSNVYAVYAFTPYSEYRKEAYDRADVLVRSYPNNYYGYLLRAYVAERRTRYPQALADNLKGRSLLAITPDEKTDIIWVADAFLLDVRANYLKALLNHDAAALRWLHAATQVKSSRYADAPLLACMYLGHLYSQANLDASAVRWYRKMQSYPGAEWMKDQGKQYEGRPMNKRRPIKKADAEKLKTWLSAQKGITP